MKIKPEDLFLNAEIKLENNAFYISGNDETYIKRTEQIIIEKLKKRGFVNTKYIEGASEYKKNSNLFFESEVVIISSTGGVTEKFIKEVNKNKDSLVVVAKNKAGDAGLKKLFEQSQNLTLFICYELNRDLKAKLLNFYTDKKNLNIDQGAYWYLVDILDNRFVFFEKEIKKLSLINKKNISVPVIDKTLSIQENKNFERLFFALLLKNPNIVNIYNSLISTQSDFQFFLQKTKFFFEIIISSNSLKEAESRFPKYLFKERASFLKIYTSAHKSGLKNIIGLIYETEREARKSGSLFKPIGLIFLLRLKKMIFNV